MSDKDDWLFQLSMKSTPDAPMLNIRAYTAQQLAEQVQEFSEYADIIGSRLDTIKAVEALGGSFKVERIRDTRDSRGMGEGTYDRTRGNSRYNGGNSRGQETDQVCEVHNLPLERRGGTKNGKKWGGLFCTSQSKPCSPIWDD